MHRASRADPDMFISDFLTGEPTRELRLMWTEGVERELILFLRDRLPDILALRVKEEKPFEPDFEACKERSCQYDSQLLLEQLRLRKPSRVLLLAVTTADLFSQGMNFVFGSADPRGGCAIISLARLGIGLPDPVPPRELLLRRALIESLHELGHLLGLGHCRKTGCVMHFSSCLSDTDLKKPDYCPRCREMLRKK